jgi:O-antigen/teichoic acid export membrane protein
MCSGYLISVILARELGPQEFGVYGVVLSVLTWIEMVATVGIPGATAKLIPEYGSQTPIVEQTARMLLLTVSVLLFCLCWLLAPAFAFLFDLPSGTTLFRLAILDIPFSGIYFSYKGLLAGHRRFGTLSVSLILYSLTKLLGILVLLAVGLSVSGALLVNVLATVGALAYLTVKLPPTRARPSYSLMNTVLRVALPMGVYLVGSQVLLNVDLWSLKSLWSGSGGDIGIYVAALNLSKVFMVVPSVLSGVLFASLSWAFARSDEVDARHHIQGAVRLAFIVLIPSCLILSRHAETVMVLVYSSAYASGGIYLGIQLITFMLVAFLDLFLHALMAAGRRYQSASILLVMIALALPLNLVLIPQAGPLGAAAALLLTMSLGTAFVTGLAYWRFGPLIRKTTLARVLVATAAVGLIDAHLSVGDQWLLAKFIALVGIYALLLSLLRELGWHDLNALTLRRRQA